MKAVVKSIVWYSTKIPMFLLSVEILIWTEGYSHFKTVCMQIQENIS